MIKINKMLLKYEFKIYYKINDTNINNNIVLKNKINYYYK